MSSWGLEVVVALQRLSPGLDPVMRVLTFLGDETAFSVFIPFIYWCVDAALGMRVIWVLLASDFVNGLLKWMVHAPRPYWVDARVRALSLEPSYGLPSGHAQSATAIWPTVARAYGTGWVRVAAVALILGVSLSRIYLGVHFPGDVFAGWIVGLALLVLAPRVEPAAARWMKARSLAAQIGAALMLSLVMLGCVLAVRVSIAGVADPPAWEAQARAAQEQSAQADRSTRERGRRPYAPRSLDSPVATLGVVFGAGAGLALMRRSARFNPRGPWAKRIARLAIGLGVVVVVRVGLAAIFPHDPTAVGLAFRYVRYAALGIAVVWFAPWLFLKLRLVEPQAPG